MRAALIKLIQQGNVIKFYKSIEWRTKRKEILIRDNNECQKCKRKGKFSKARCVHHKKHIKKFPELALSDDNLESLCDPCHNEEHPEKFNKMKPKTKSISEERW